MSFYALPSKPVLQRPLESAQYLSIRYTERLAENHVVGSVGSRGDSYDNALAESVIGLYKTEPLRNRGPWKGLDDLELATLESLDWYNHRRLHGELGHVPPPNRRPATTLNNPQQQRLRLKLNSLRKTRGDSRSRHVLS